MDRTPLRLLILLLLNSRAAAFNIIAQPARIALATSMENDFVLLTTRSRAITTMLVKKQSKKPPAAESTGMQEPWKTLVTVGYFSLYVALFGRMALALVERVVG